VETRLKNLYDIELFESVGSSLTIILLGIIYLAQILYAGRNNTKSQDKVVLAIGAHPDDIELGCGGYLLKAKAEGAKVYGVTLTKGERGTESVNVREMEARNAASFMELDGCWILDFPDTHLQENVGKVREKLEEILKKVSPTVVLVHNQYDHHADHRAAFNATKEAARLIPTILTYETVSTPSDYKADYFVDITDHLAEMLHAIGLHKSQKHKSYMDPELLKGRAAHRGIQSGVPYAMAFQTHRIVN
jgi:LmbE family N-acetylglucosaminyl deacetylase